jgi:serine protease AprX
MTRDNYWPSVTAHPMLLAVINCVLSVGDRVMGTRGAHGGSWEFSAKLRLAAAGAAALTGIAVVPALASSPIPGGMTSVDQVIGAQNAWAAGADGHGVGVALVDTGVTPVPGLNAPGKLTYGPDLSFDSQNPSLTNIDGYGHGTALAGIIAGNDGTDGGYKGVAPKANLVSVKVGASTGAADVSQMIAGIDWVTEHADDNNLNIRVLNLSFGTNSIQPYLIDPLAHAAEVAWRHGIVVVASVGNDGWASRTLADPAIDPYIIAVGADDPQGTVDPSDDTVPSFSQRSRGPRQPDVLAPGTYVPGLLSPGSLLAQQNPQAVIDNRYLRGSGTSQAAAVVSGAVADLLSARPNLSPDQVKQILTDTAANIQTQRQWWTGAGLIQLPAALRDQTPSYWRANQDYPRSLGFGSLELARGDNHISMDGVELDGNQDIFGNRWPSIRMALDEENENAWNGGTFNGSTWSGSSWTGSSWSGSTWSGSSWTGSTWSGSSWSGSTWSGSSWSGSSWSGSSWSGSSWSGSSWSGDSWMGATWD